MEEVLMSFVFDYEKSTYRIELIQVNNGKQYVSLKQTTFLLLDETKNEIKIRPELFDEVLGALNKIRDKIPVKNPSRKFLNETDKKDLISRYLNKNLTVESLSVQFDITPDLVRSILIENNIVVASAQGKKYEPGKKFRKRKRWK